jgi:hypothetical protein
MLVGGSRKKVATAAISAGQQEVVSNKCDVLLAVCLKTASENCFVLAVE